jgi:hypothetical protein
MRARTLRIPRKRLRDVVMTAKDDQGLSGVSDDQAKKQLSPAAERALAEAAARRAEIDRKIAERPKELSGRRGPEPTRYGDWEAKGIASDF